MLVAQIMEQLPQDSSQIPQAPGTPSQNTMSYGCELPLIDTEVIPTGSFHGNVQRQFESKVHCIT